MLRSSANRTVGPYANYVRSRDSYSGYSALALSGVYGDHHGGRGDDGHKFGGRLGINRRDRRNASPIEWQNVECKPAHDTRLYGGSRTYNSEKEIGKRMKVKFILLRNSKRRSIIYLFVSFFFHSQ